jgi:hypothetical protein
MFLTSDFISSTLKVGTESFPETLENFHNWTRLSAQEDFIEH